MLVIYYGIFGLWRRLSQISPKERRNIGRESSAASEPREHVLSLWTMILKQEFEELDFSFENIIILLPGYNVFTCINCNHNKV